jgi:hypothetical protein
MIRVVGSKNIFSVAVLCAGVLIAGCSGGTGPAPTSSTTSSTTTSTPAQAITTPTVIINGQSVTVPTNVPGKPITPNLETGGQVIISSTGMLPYKIFVRVGQTVTFTNLTDKPVSVKSKFQNYFSSGPIAPGGTFSYSSPTGISILYKTSTGFEGRLIIGAFQ